MNKYKTGPYALNRIKTNFQSSLTNTKLQKQTVEGKVIDFSRKSKLNLNIAEQGKLISLYEQASNWRHLVQRSVIRY